MGIFRGALIFPVDYSNDPTTKAHLSLPAHVSAFSGQNLCPGTSCPFFAFDGPFRVRSVFILGTMTSKMKPREPSFIPTASGWRGCLGPLGQALCVHSLPCLYLGSFMVLIAKREVRWFRSTPGRNLKSCAKRRTASDPRKICNLCSRRKSG